MKTTKQQTKQSKKTKQPAKQPLANKPAPKQAAGIGSTWSPKASTGVWNTPSNWSPTSVPTGTAAFGAGAQTAITFATGSSASIESIEFGAGAAAYTFMFTAASPGKPTLTIAGAGVSNAASNVQRIMVAASSASRNNPQLAFTSGASAGGSGVQYAAGPSSPSAAGGGVIRFFDTSTAGAASFSVTTGAGTPPKHNSTVGGEVTFSDTSSGGTATFAVYGSTSTTDGDTFGNVVFHDSASAAQATLTNIGGTVSGGDGGNTQFYETATAGNGLFHNLGATASGANGGDTAFDGTATAASGQFHNYASPVSGGRGGVTSFNNNAPSMTGTQGSTAGNGQFFNYGAQAKGQGGGHTYFQAKYGSPSAANGMFVNYGSAVPGENANVGRTVLSITLPQPSAYTPNAGHATFWNLPGTGPGAPGGLTLFTVYPPDDVPAASAANKRAKPRTAAAVKSTGPSAGNATCINLGATTKGAYGGQTQFSGVNGVVSSAANAQLVATGGTNGGYGGRIAFYAGSSGGSATVDLSGTGTLDVAGAGGTITIGAMNLAGGVIACSVGSETTDVVVTGNVKIVAAVTFDFRAGKGFAHDTSYTILTAPNMSSVDVGLFSGNAVGGAAPDFTIDGNSLKVSFGKTASKGTRGIRRR